MTLDASKLANALQDLSDHPGADRTACAQKWAQAVGHYFQTVQLAAVVPASSTVSAAQGALSNALDTAFKVRSRQALASSMEAAFSAFAATVATGMAPLYTAVPPVGQVGFDQLFTPPFARSHQAAAQKLSAAIHAWALTGSATLTAPPHTPATWI